MSILQIESINCRGLREKRKRLDIFEKAQKESVNILCLQETHLTSEDQQMLKSEWNATHIIAGSETNAGGVMIIIEHNFEFKIHAKYFSQDGRYIIIDLEIPEVARFILVNLYAPNKDSPIFFEKLFDDIEKLNNKNIMIVGDWNLVNNFELDTLNYKNRNNPKACEIVDSYKNKLDLVDIWRMAHPSLKHYTWKQLFYKKMARLDFFLISDSLLSLYANSTIKPAYRSDHSPINLQIYISKHKRGKGTWKLNNSLLLDLELRNRIEEEIELIISTYACTPYHPDFVKEYKYNQIDLMIGIDLFWEVLHAQLRGLIMSYASGKKRQQNYQENKLIKEISVLESKLAQELNNENYISNLKEKNNELEEIRMHKLNGSLIRSRWQNVSMGEKPSKYFLNMENKNFVSKNIRELKIGNKTINNPKDILEEMKIFYNNLYKHKEHLDIEDTELNRVRDSLPKLNNADRENMEKEITMEELGFIIKKSKNNKSPGASGFSNEFYKIFWPNIKILLLNLLNYYRENGKLNTSQLSGIITCIPKGGKMRNNLKNWRPITLLNSIYKFYSSIIAERIKVLLPRLINPDQKGFVNNRFIGENTRLTYDIINESNTKNIDGLIILIDFEKAFDSISWSFISKTLRIFNFGEDTIKWIESLQKGANSTILQNGNFSDKLSLGRGCRQGDPVSPYLFVLAAEILAEAIRTNKNIEGLTFFKKEHKVSQYADDTTLFIKANESSIYNSMSTLKLYEVISGLRVNTEKTKVIKIGGWRDSRTILCQNMNLEWSQKFTSLGILYDINNFSRITDQNIDGKIKEIQKLIFIWNGRYLTPYGKIIIIKSLLISKITHVLLSLPSPSPFTINKLEKIFQEFIWGQKNPKFRKEVMENALNLGGLKMTNLRTFDSALKLSWLKRMINQNEGWAEFPQEFNIHNIFKYGDNYTKILLSKIKNDFWKDIILSVQKLEKVCNIFNHAQLQSSPLWYNGQLKLSYRQEWANKGYYIIRDILNDQGSLMTNEELNGRGLKIHFLDYENLKFNFNKMTLNLVLISPIIGPHLPRQLYEIGLAQTGCSGTYGKLMSFDYKIIQNVKQKWEEVLNDEITYLTVEKAFRDISKMKESAYYKYLQFKLLHSRTITNVKLLMMNISDSDIL